MGADILVKKKGDRRFLGSTTSTTPVDDDDGCTSNFSLEIFYDDGCSFFDRSPSAVDPFLHDDDGADDPYITAEHRRIHWESQQFLLQEIVEQYYSIGSKLREEMQRQIEIARESGYCDCKLRQCTTTCLRRAAVNQLRSKGFNASLYVSQWKTTHNTPAGWHEYIEVRANAQGKGKKKQIAFVVELAFRDEFRMAKASEEYKALVNQVPEMYIGKWEHMKAIIRLVCDAAKKSAEEQSIHMGPWRKMNFMLRKWSSRVRTTNSSSSNLQETFTTARQQLSNSIA